MLGILKDHAARPWEVPEDASNKEKPTDGAYMDDAIDLLADASADQLVRKLGCAMAIVFNTFIAFGFKVNMSNGKAEAMLQLRGHNARKLTSQIHADGHVSLVSCTWLQWCNNDHGVGD